MMKSSYTNYVLLLLLWIFISCKKQSLEPVVIPCQSIAYVIDKLDSNKKLISTDTSIYWPKVCGEELQRFMAMSKAPQPICGQPGASMRLVIWTPSYSKDLH